MQATSAKNLTRPVSLTFEKFEHRLEPRFVIPLSANAPSTFLSHGRSFETMFQEPAQSSSDACRIARITCATVAGLDKKFSPLRQIRNQQRQSAREIIKRFIRCPNHRLLIWSIT